MRLFGELPSASAGGQIDPGAGADVVAALDSRAPGGLVLHELTWYSTSAFYLGMRLVPTSVVPDSAFNPVGFVRCRTNVYRGPIFSTLRIGPKDGAFADVLGSGDHVWALEGGANKKTQFLIQHDVWVPRDFTMLFMTPFSTVLSVSGLNCFWSELPDPEVSAAGVT